MLRVRSASPVAAEQQLAFRPENVGNDSRHGDDPLATGICHASDEVSAGTHRPADEIFHMLFPSVVAA